MKIYKYPLEIKDSNFIEFPSNHEVLDVQMQNGRLCLWALVDEYSILKTQRDVKVFGTGNPIYGSVGKYIGTVQDNEFVWHVFIV